MTLLELFVPSWNRPVPAFIGNLMAWLWVSGMLALIPWAFVFAYGYGQSWQGPVMAVLLVAAPIVGFLLVPVWRLRRLIRESNRYGETGKPPVWKISPLLRREGR